ncbi:MAG TPA: deoxyribose-phosphate aldolase [Terriglobales bacterium]|nr:deoxyribose-phosphate aldolase [Terriglobales bacterium]
MIALAPDEYRELVETIARELQPMPAGELAAALEPTLLAADATAAQVDQLCRDAAAWGVPAVCVNPYRVAQAANALRGTAVAVAAVVGFPLGAALPTSKRDEAACCLALGADELDLMINLGALKSGADAIVEDEIAAVAELAHGAGARLKVILELPKLDPEEIARAGAAALAAGADYLKTSTGFGTRAATAADVRTLLGVAQNRARIKAAGGIRTRAHAEALLAAGASRIGTSTPAEVLGS